MGLGGFAASAAPADPNTTETPDSWMKSGSTPANDEPTAGTSSEQSRVVGPFVSALATGTPIVRLANAAAPSTVNLLLMFPPACEDTPSCRRRGRAILPPHQ